MFKTWSHANKLQIVMNKKKHTTFFLVSLSDRVSSQSYGLYWEIHPQGHGCSELDPVHNKAAVSVLGKSFQMKRFSILAKRLTGSLDQLAKIFYNMQVFI